MLVIGLTVVHAFYWTDLRMRAPIVPALALIAAGGCGRGGRFRALAGDDTIERPARDEPSEANGDGRDRSA